MRRRSIQLNSSSPAPPVIYIRYLCSPFDGLESIVSKPSLLVIGCGDLGSPLAGACAAAGWDVWGLRRSKQPLPPGVEPIFADVARPETLEPLRSLAPGYVVAALTPGESSDARYRAVYVEGLAHCLQRLDRSRLRRFFWVSSTSVYHQHDGSRVDETTPATPTGFAGARLLEAERVLADSGLPHTILRLGGIYGPGRDRLLRQLRAGQRSPEAAGHYSNRIHRDDAVGILWFLLQGAAAGMELETLYLGVDREPTPISEVERWFAGFLGLDYDAMTALAAPARGGNRYCDSTRLQRLGYRFAYPDFRVGLPTLLDREMR